MAATAVRTEKAYEKYAWVLPFMFGVFLATLIGGSFMILRHTAEGVPLPASTPAAAVDRIDTVYLFSGLTLVFVGLSIALVSFTSFRMAQRWAWYFVLLVLLWLFVDEVLAGGSDPIAYIGIVLSAFGLILPYRKFFPKKQP